MARYNVGDVVLVYWPWTEEDGSVSWKVRPAIIFGLEGDQERLIIQITTRNRSGKLPGIWVLKESAEGQEMGIVHDSFINVTKTYEVHVRDIVRVIGYCHLLLPRIEEIYNNSKNH